MYKQSYNGKAGLARDFVGCKDRKSKIMRGFS
jgi:hypothetical protein